MWIRTSETLLNLDRVQSFSFNDSSNQTVFVYADFSGCKELVCVCPLDKVQLLLNAIARALGNNIKVFDLQEWLDHLL